MTRRSLAALWDERVRATPNAAALAEPGRRTSYGEMDLQNRAIAQRLLEWGVRPGLKVAILLPSDHGLLHLLLALARIGGVAVPIATQSTKDEALFVLRHSGAERLITDARGLSTFGPALQRPSWFPEIATTDAGTGLPVMALDDPGDASLALDAPTPTPDSPLAILYTSGSTGRPKGVLLRQSSAVTAGASIAARLEYSDSDVVFSPLPLFHAAAPLMNWAPAVHVGATFALMPRFSASSFWQQADAVGATTTLVVPTIPSILLATEPRPDDRDHSLRLLTTHRYMSDFVERFGVTMCTVWGMTETGTLGVMTAPGQSPAENLVGHPYPPDARVRIMDGGRVVGPGQTGELWFSHDDVMVGYHADPEATAETMVDGWIRSGDLARMDEAGNVYFVGRLKNMIKHSGENVSAEEVEGRIRAHPSVAEVAVVGVPDPIRAEDVYARVVLHPGATVAVQDLIGWCRQKLADFKVPRYFEISDAPLPRLRTQKVDIQAVRSAADPLVAYDRSRRWPASAPTHSPS